MNRLARETSPYLRQHRDNPVDWYPWGEEAFARARAEDKPVLLSVGYSACHWCHVMAHESFEDEETAAVMNELFVNVKVDREERPDVDAVYMDAVQALTGQGGWPMTVFLTPDGRPFFGGTYFPKRSAHGRPGFVELLHAVDEAWREDREQLLLQAERVAEAINSGRRLNGGGVRTAPAPALLERGYEQLRKSFDPEWGGFGRAPKFPTPASVELVLRRHARDGSEEARRIAGTTLDAMAAGGIYDHLGGGFHRYSVDAFWMVPHFEKMLYDNAGLVRAYLHGWQLTGREAYRQVLEETVAYVLRDLRAPEGGLYSAEDADSEGEEGAFYVWSYAELLEVGGADAVEWYGATKGGNFEGRNILHRPKGGELVRPEAVERGRRALFERRCTRPRPGLDDKVLTEWNAMFVASLAEAGAALGRDDWLRDARETAEFLLAHLRRPDDGRWLRSWQREGGARHLAYGVDHAWAVEAFTRLAEATGEARWLQAARETADALLELFWDDEAGGVFTTGHDAERLIVRHKDILDGATPSTNAVAAVALVRLGALTGERRYTECAEGIVWMLGDLMQRHPGAFTYALVAADLLERGVTEVAVVGDAPALVRGVQSTYLPDAVLAWGEPYPSPLWEGRAPGRAYVCRDYACRAPVTTVEDLLAQLRPAPVRPPAGGSAR